MEDTYLTQKPRKKSQRKLREKEEREKKKAEKDKEENAEKNESLAKLEMELNKHQTNLKVREESTKIGNQKVQEALSEKIFIQRENPKCTSYD